MANGNPTEGQTAERRCQWCGLSMMLEQINYKCTKNPNGRFCTRTIPPVPIAAPAERGFYEELDYREQQARLKRLESRPADLHDYQGCEKSMPMEMAKSGAQIRKMHDDVYFVDWGNVRFGTSLQQMENLAYDLNLYVQRMKGGQR